MAFNLVDLLKQAAHTVTGCDLGLFDGCAWEEVVPADRDLHIDVREVTLKDLGGHDCVTHLVAIFNDPMGGHHQLRQRLPLRRIHHAARASDCSYFMIFETDLLKKNFFKTFNFVTSIVICNTGLALEDVESICLRCQAIMNRFT